jgi:hypothetical protein
LSPLANENGHHFKMLRHLRLKMAAVMVVLLISLSCGSKSDVSRDTTHKSLPESLPPVGYTIQIGAFAKLDNAVQLVAKLQHQGLDAYHFRNRVGLYKVRVGSYPTKQAARIKADNLKTTGIIDEYYLIGPTDHLLVRPGSQINKNLREEIVRTANQFIGVRYRWGGQSSDTGFDCSGLTMAVYRLNGLELPRSSRQQWKVGKPVESGQLSKGDLVFFATSGSGRVSHVGIYIGNKKFLHAPSSGRRIRISSMSNSYYKSRYLGARTYL